MSLETVSPCAIWVRKELTYTLLSSSDRSGISPADCNPAMMEVGSSDVSVISSG